MPKFDKCVECARPFTAENVYSREGAKETQISGMCETCFDNLMGDGETDYRAEAQKKLWAEMQADLERTVYEDSDSAGNSFW